MKWLRSISPVAFPALLILAGLLTPGCEEEPTKNEPAIGSLAGEVRDGNSGALIGKAQVRAVINGVADTSAFPGLIRWEDGEAMWWDTVGTFLIDSLNTGLDAFIVSRELYYTQEYVVDIAPGANEMTFYLDPLCPYDTLVTQYQYSRMHVRILGQWYLIDQGGDGWEVMNTEIVVKFKENVSQAEIDAFNAAMGVQIIRTNFDGSYDCWILNGADPMCTLLAYYGSGLVEYVLVGTYTVHL